MRIDADELMEAIVNDEMAGFCLDCGERTSSLVEPDARNYTCDGCGQPQVFGAEELLIMGYSG